VSRREAFKNIFGFSVSAKRCNYRKFDDKVSAKRCNYRKFDDKLM